MTIPEQVLGVGCSCWRFLILRVYFPADYVKTHGVLRLFQKRLLWSQGCTHADEVCLSFGDSISKRWIIKEWLFMSGVPNFIKLNMCNKIGISTNLLRSYTCWLKQVLDGWWIHGKKRFLHRQAQGYGEARMRIEEVSDLVQLLILRVCLCAPCHLWSLWHLL